MSPSSTLATSLAHKLRQTMKRNARMLGASSRTCQSLNASFLFVSRFPILTKDNLFIVLSARLVQQQRAQSGQTNIGRANSVATTSSAASGGSSLRVAAPPSRAASTSAAFKKAPPPPGSSLAPPPPPYSVSPTSSVHSTASASAATKRAPPPPPPLKPKPKPTPQIKYVVALYDFAAQVRARILCGKTELKLFLGRRRFIIQRWRQD